MARAKIAILIHSHCLAFADPSRLSQMGKAATEKGAELARELEASCVILSAAYGTWKTEARLKQGIVEYAGIPQGSIRVLGEVTDTYDETKQARAILNELNIDVLV